MLLAIDTSTRTVGLALYDGVQVLSEMIWSSSNYHTVELAPAINQMLNRADISMRALSGIAIAIGPGSFTGIRIGLAVAKGLALARGKPIFGVPTLDILAAAQPAQDMRLAAVLRAGRARLAVGWYHREGDAWSSSGDAEILTARNLNARINEPTMICGELDEEERRLLARKWVNVVLCSPAQSVRRPSFLAELAWDRLQADRWDDPATLAPIYLRTHNNIPE